MIRMLELFGGVFVIAGTMIVPVLTLVPWAVKRGWAANAVALIAFIGLPGTAALVYGELLK